MTEAKADQAKPQQADVDEAALIAAVEADQRARSAIPADQLERFYREKNAREDADPEIKANREACRQASEEIVRALAEGDSYERAVERGKAACGRDELDFDDRQRAAEIRGEVAREVFGRRRSHARRGATHDGAPQLTARTARTERGHGDRRGERSRSRSASSDDPDPDPDGVDAHARRLCAFCNRDLPAGRSPKALYCTDTHADRDRQRRKRARDRARSQMPRIPTTADFRRMLEITDEDIRRLRELVTCHCNGDRLELDRGWCFKCGHLLPHGEAGRARLYAAFAQRIAGVRTAPGVRA